MYQATDLEISQVYEVLAKEVEHRLGNETKNVTGNRRHSHLASTSKMQAIMTEIALEVFLEYPIQYALTILVGLYRMLLEVRAWPVLAGVGWNLGLLFLASLGFWQMFKARRIADAAFLLLPCLYFTAGTLLVATASFDTRARVMITPLLAIMAAHGVMHLLNRRKAASASLLPPADS